MNGLQTGEFAREMWRWRKIANPRYELQFDGAINGFDDAKTSSLAVERRLKSYSEESAKAIFTTYKRAKIWRNFILSNKLNNYHNF